MSSTTGTDSTKDASTSGSKPTEKILESAITALMFAVAGSMWAGGYYYGNGVVAIIGAGIVGGLLYDIAVSRGKYVLPTSDTDGINLGSAYGAIVGFAIAIAILQPLFPTPGPTVYASFDTFLIALGVKSGSEFASTTRMELTKDPSSISFDAKELVTPKGSKTVAGALLDKDGNSLKNKVVHILLKDTTAGVQYSRDTLSTDLVNGVNFTFQFPQLDASTWESWASWDGDDKNQAVESAHETFKTTS